MKTTRHSWYLRTGDGIEGPFPARVIANRILLGRLGEGAWVSRDRMVWVQAGRTPELMPEALLEARRNPGDPQAQERLEAARRWADEREGERSLSVRARTGSVERRAPVAWPAYAVAGGLLLIVLLLSLTLPERETTSAAQCEGAPAAGVNWRHCDLSDRRLANAVLTGADLSSAILTEVVLQAADLRGADLAYADLRGARLRGANLSEARLLGADLQRADLASTDLRGADLRHANLIGADLRNARLEDARLDFAQWSEHHLCLPGSTGECRPARKD